MILNYCRKYQIHSNYFPLHFIVPFLNNHILLLTYYLLHLIINILLVIPFHYFIYFNLHYILKKNDLNYQISYYSPFILFLKFCN